MNASIAHLAAWLSDIEPGTTYSTSVLDEVPAPYRCAAMTVPTEGDTFVGREVTRALAMELGPDQARALALEMRRIAGERLAEADELIALAAQKRGGMH